MLTVVRPSDSFANACDSARSVSGSTADVASSKISSPGSASWARASATSWRSPTDRASPRSPTWVARPSGMLLIHQSRSSEANARLTSSSVASGRPNRTFSKIVVSNKKPSWATNRTARARESCETSRRSIPSSRIRPSVGSASRARSLANEVLPEPVSPTMAALTPADSCRSIPCRTG